MTLRLRPMRPPDVEALLPFEQELFAGDPPWTAEQFRSELAGVPQTRWYIVAEADGELAGYTGLMFSGDTADIQTLAVAPDHQRRGIGTTLLFALLDEARHRGARELLLEVRADNEPALALYTRHGFEQIARRRGYYQGGRTDGLILRWPHPMTRRPQRLPSPTGWVPHRGVNTVIASQSGTIQPP